MDIEGIAPSFVSNSIITKDMNGNITVYYALPSPACRPLLMLARALDVKLNLKPINLLAGEHLTPEFLKSITAVGLQMNPQHTLPTMVEDDFILWESRAIMKYLIDVYAKDNVYYPPDPKDAAVVNQRLYFDATVLTPRLIDYYIPVAMSGQQPDVAKRVKYEEALALLDEFLSKTTWVAGQQMTIADFCIVSNIATGEALGFDITSYPSITAWYERTKTALEQYGYEEINQEGADIIGKLFKSKLK